MKRILLLLVIIPCSLLAQNDIRNVNWGWSKEQVKKAELLPLLSSVKENLYYEATLAGTKFKILYSFTQSKLTGLFFLHDEKLANSNTYITDYDNLSKILTDKYGDPLSVNELWNNDLFKSDDRFRWGSGLLNGHLKMRTVWTNAKTKVTLFVYGEDYKINLSITYASIELEELANKASKEKNNKDF